MKRTPFCPGFLCALLLLGASQGPVISAQGTVRSALFDYILKMSSTPQQSPPPANPPPTPPPSPPATGTAGGATGTGTGGGGSDSGLFGLYSQMAQNSPPQGDPSTSSTSAGSSYMDTLSAMIGGSQAQQQPQAASQPSSGGTASSLLRQTPGGSPSVGGSDPMTYYSQLMQTMSQAPGQPGVTPAPHRAAPFSDPFPTTLPPPPTPPPAPKVLPFVPPEWNLTRAGSWQTPAAVAAWGHGSNLLGGATRWSSRTPLHPAPRRSAPAPHPLSKMSMVPRIRNMINKQATQFGDLAYYQQHGCVDPTPAKPGPGGIRPTQTLWYGCQSPVSRMVCMRVGKTQGGARPGPMAMMMSAMNPAMTRAMEKCLTPKMMTRIMFQGFSGGAGGMNPMMMMALNGGGGGGGGMAAMMPVLLTMMNQNNQAASGAAAGGGGGAGVPSTSQSFGPTPTKSPYPNPTRSNTLISQAGRIPHGAALPLAQSSGGSLMSALSSSSSSSSMPSGAAVPGSAGSEPDCSSLMPLMMSRMMAAGEGLNSPEAMEAIGELRKQFLPYSCQELRIKYTGLPLRMCCPGRVDSPTVFDLFKAKNAGGA